MKKTLFLLITFLLVGFASCGSDAADDDPVAGGSSKNPLIGTWYEDHSTEWFIWTFDKTTVTCKTAWKGNEAGEPWNDGRNQFNYTWDSETQKGSFSYRYESKKNNSLVTTIYNFEYFEGKLYCEEIEDGKRPYTFKMIKNPDNVKVSEIYLSRNKISLWSGNTGEIGAYIYPKNASFPSISWSSSNPKVATVQNGKITAVGPGSCVIIAESEKKEAKAECKVSVYSKDLLGNWHGDWINTTYSHAEGNGDTISYWTSYIDFSLSSDLDYSTNGYGNMLYHYDSAPWDRKFYRIDWEMRGDTLFITHPSNSNLDTKFYQIKVTGNKLTGYNQWNNKLEFTKYSSFDWSSYENDYWWGHDGWYENPNWNWTRAVNIEKPVILENLKSY